MIIILKSYDAKKLKEHEKIYDEMSYIYKLYTVRRHSSYPDTWLFMSPNNGHRIYYSRSSTAKKDVMKSAEMYFRENGI